jgi:hypothetical protein
VREDTHVYESDVLLLVVVLFGTVFCEIGAEVEEIFERRIFPFIIPRRLRDVDIYWMVDLAVLRSRYFLGIGWYPF